ncbi:MAG: transketolase [Planctomycetota bacterium]|nr:transketolase [Planctomycetota bacterium]
MSAVCIPPEVALDPAFQAITAIRTLAMDAVQTANSGHPGTPVSLAPVAYTLWQDFLQYDPADPTWRNRDRFVLSAGHASLLLYGVLHIAGVKRLGTDGKPTATPAISLDDIKKFRQLHSVCAGHPEYHFCSGVETTTGPLGNGASTSVGMAMAEKWLAANYNRPNHEIFGYQVWSILGDGCMMEGITSEAASLAGHLQLDNLVWIYDSNRITIEGSTDLAFNEDTGARFLAYGWNVLRLADVNDLPRLRDVLAKARATTGRPTLIVADSHIAWGVPGKMDSHSAHGEPLGWDNIEKAKLVYGVDPKARFHVPEIVYQHMADGLGKRGAAQHAAWNVTFDSYCKTYPELARQLEEIDSGSLPAGWDKDLPKFPSGEVDDPKNPGKKKINSAATRDASGKVLNAIAKNVPWLIGGSADLAPSTKTLLTFSGANAFQPESFGGRNLHFGVREHAMGAILNGLVLSKLRAYGSGFLIFSDYGRGSLRLGAIMELPVLYIFTHDSLGVGEDGPTHQPIEQLAGLRAIPHMTVLRPADANEVAEAWRWIMPRRHHPVVLVLTRQELTIVDREKYGAASGLAKGAYVLADAPDGKPKVLLLGTGSEVNLCLAAHDELAKEGISSRVVSMPSWEIFEATCAKDPAYREQVLPSAVTARVAVEMGSPMGWAQYAGSTGAVIAMRSFGASAPLKDLLVEFGFTPAKVVEAAKAQLAK